MVASRPSESGRYVFAAAAISRHSVRLAARSARALRPASTCRPIRLVHVVLGFDAGSAEVWVLDYGVTLGDPTEDDVWAAPTFESSAAGAPLVGSGRVPSRRGEADSRGQWARWA